MQATTAPVKATDAGIAEGLYAVLNHLMKSSVRDVLAAMADADVTPTTYKALHALAEHEPRDDVCVKDLAEDLVLSLPATSRAVDGLLKKGLVTRTEAEHDRRIKQIALTPAGREITRRLFELRIAGIREFVASLDPADRKRLATTLEPIFERTPHA